MAVTTDPFEAIYQRGYQLRCEGRYAEAKAELLKVVSQNPSHLLARHQLGLIQGFEGDFDGSLATLGTLCNLAPGNLDIRYDLAMTQMMLGMYEEACDNLKKILSMNPGYEKAARQTGYCP